MLRVTFVIVTTGAVAVLARPDIQYDLTRAEDYFEDFLLEYGKQYISIEEKAKRLEVFKQALEKYNKLNVNNPLAVFGIHEYSDLTVEEMKFRNGKLDSMVNFGIADNCTVVTQSPEGNPPESWDCRENNAVTDVQDQIDCGSCWAFSATGNLEGQYAIKYGNLIPFSEQQLIDCDYRCSGCIGGWATVTYQYMKEMGIMAYDDYPYKGEYRKCKYDPNKVKVKVSGCEKFKLSNEEQLRNLLYKRGPISIAIDASDLEGYSGGIISNCPADRDTHAVLLVGYGTEKNVPYWTFKNSWGTKFGEKGYFRLKRGVDCCGMMDFRVTSAIIV